MKIRNLRIKAFRTIKKEISIAVKGGVCLVGPNNVGKSNILKAIQMLFTGYNNRYGYDFERDFPFDIKGAQTSIICTFSCDDGDPYDDDIWNRYQQLQTMLAQNPRTTRTIEVHQTFSKNTPVYRLFANTKVPSDVASNFSNRQKQLVQDILAKFVIYYVPSNKSFEDLYNSLVLDFLRTEVAVAVNPVLHQVQALLDSISDELTATLAQVKDGQLRVALRPPANNAKDLLSGFDFRLLDPADTSVFAKGLGIQSAALIAFFVWISRRNHQGSRETLWLLEEPESYLHPSLATSVSALVTQLANESTVVLTTHSMAFVAKEPEKNVGLRMTTDGTTVTQFTTYREVTEGLRKTLGVEFSDFFSLDLHNVFVEGKSDKKYIEWYLEWREKAGKPALAILGSNRCSIMDFGGVGQLGDFLRANYQHIYRERPIVALFDGDSAAEKEYKPLQQICGQLKIPFASNLHYIVVRKGHSIEGIYPDAWILEHYDTHNNWYHECISDALEGLISFRIKDTHKGDFARDMMQRAEAEGSDVWSVKWERIVLLIDDALQRQVAKMAGQLAPPEAEPAND